MNLMMNDKIIIKAVGDIMLGDHPVCIGHGIRSTLGNDNVASLLGDFVSEFKKADMVFGNLETVLSDVGLTESNIKSFELRGEPRRASELRDAGFNCLSVANNHALQHGEEAFNNTVNLLNDNNIKPIGLSRAHKFNVQVFELNGMRIAFLGFSIRPEKFSSTTELPYDKRAYEDCAELCSKVEGLSKSHDFVILSLHWGDEYLNYPSKKQTEFAHALISAGANVILGHHPHVLQGIECYSGGVIVYSLGNFIFDKWQDNPRQTMVVTLTLSKNKEINVQYEAAYIDKKFRVEKARGRKGDIIIKNIESYSDKINEIPASRDYTDERYAILAEKAYKKFRMQSYLYFLLNIYKYDLKSIVQSSIRFIKRRLGTYKHV